jgi:hypothetical protein
MATVTVVVPFVLAEGVQQMRLLPNQRPVKQFVAAGYDPPLHDRVHARHPDAAEYDRTPFHQRQVGAFRMPTESADRLTCRLT